jgi:hypothetical protein
LAGNRKKKLHFTGEETTLWSFPGAKGIETDSLQPGSLPPRESWKELPDAKGIETAISPPKDSTILISWKKFPNAKGIETVKP